MIHIELSLRISRDRPQPEQPEGPAVYDLSGAYIERDPSLDTDTDPETRHRPRTGFTPKEDQPR